MQISKLESAACEELKKNNLVLFKIKDLCLLLKIGKPKAYNLVKSLKKKGIIRKAGKGFFAFKDANEFVIGQNLNYPSYISFWSALNYYGLSDQTPKKIFLAATRYLKEINGFKYVTISKKRFFGYVKIGEIVIAEKEKAIIDSLLFPKFAGGIKEVMKCMHIALNNINMKKLVDYSLKVESKAVLRRLGFILENFGYEGKKLNMIAKQIGKGYELLDPTLKKKNQFNHKWLLDINW